MDKLELNLGSDVKINTGKKRRGLCKTPLVPRNRTSVKVRLTAENHFRELKRQQRP